MSTALVPVARTISRINALVQNNPLVFDTLRCLLEGRHKIEVKDGVPYPKRNSGFPKSNSVERERELISFAKGLYGLTPDLKSKLTKGTNNNLDSLLLRQSLRSTTFKESPASVI